MAYTAAELRSFAAAEQAQMIADRRHLHRHPELSYQEFETSAFLAQKLEALGLPYVRSSKTGLLATLDTGREGPTVLLRADIDALPVTENTKNLCCERAAVSETPGLMHACGHDAHVAMLLAAARVLCARRDALCGKVLFCFEDGEEISIGEIHTPEHSAKAMIAAIGEQRVDACWALHVYYGLPAGTISIQAGPRMAGITIFDVEFTGKGGHGSRPDQAVSPIFAAAYALTNAANCFVNEVDVTKTVTFGVGRIEGGRLQNVIPETASFQGTARYFDVPAGRAAIESVHRVCEHTALAHRCTLSRFKIGEMGAVINDTAVAERAAAAAEAVLGKAALVNCPPWFASESYSHYLEKWPGVLGFVGLANPEKGTGALHHCPEFDLDEDCMTVGAAATLAFVFDRLAK